MQRLGYMGMVGFWGSGVGCNNASGIQTLHQPPSCNSCSSFRLVSLPCPGHFKYYAACTFNSMYVRQLVLFWYAYIGQRDKGGVLKVRFWLQLCVWSLSLPFLSLVKVLDDIVRNPVTLFKTYVIAFFHVWIPHVTLIPHKSLCYSNSAICKMSLLLPPVSIYLPSTECCKSHTVFSDSATNIHFQGPVCYVCLESKHLIFIQSKS